MTDTLAIAKMLDHTLLKPEATRDEIITACNEAKEWNFATLAIQPTNIPLAHTLLQGSQTGITAAIAYPHGSWSIAQKCKEIEHCLSMGATDCDYVLDIGSIRENRYSVIRQEAKACRKATGSAILKIILEVTLLTDEQIGTACTICAEEGCDFVKTSTGYLGSPSLEQVGLMCRTVKGSQTKVKAAGGFSSAQRVLAAIELGVARIGTSSSIKLIHQFEKLGDTYDTMRQTY